MVSSCNKGAGGIRDVCTAVHVCIIWWSPCAFDLVSFSPLQARTRHLTVCSQRVVCKETYIPSIYNQASSYRSWNVHSGFPRIDANEAACGWEET